MTLYNLSFAGAGRVAGALCRGMYSKGINIRHIVSESQAGAKMLADEPASLLMNRLILSLLQSLITG
jgi:hypothetical protein